MLVPYSVIRAPEALGFDSAKEMLEKHVATGDMLGFGMNTEGKSQEDVMELFEPALAAADFTIADFTVGFYIGKLADDVISKTHTIDMTQRVHAPLPWHLDNPPIVNGPRVRWITFHFSPIGFGRGHLARIRADRLARFGKEEYTAAKHQLKNGMIDPELLSRTVEVATIGVRRLLIFGSVGHSPAFHLMTTTSAGRFSKSYYAKCKSAD